MHLQRLWLSLLLALAAGCGTTKWTDTSRTATEQLLLTDSMDRAVSQLDFRAVAGRKMYIDEGPLRSIVDAPYLVSSIRQHTLASGGILAEKREEADYVLEVRAGAVGTDRHDLLFGVPAISVPAVGAAGVPSQIPELPLMKRTDQRGVAKIAVFVYNRHTGRPLWQSGVIPVESKAKAVWVFGAGPFQRGSIYNGTKFAGDHVNIPLIDPETKVGDRSGVSVADQAFFVEQKEPLVEKLPRAPGQHWTSPGTNFLQTGFNAADGGNGDRNGPSGNASPGSLPPGQVTPSGTPQGPMQGPPPSGPSDTSYGYGNTVPQINLPAQLPFGMNTPWAEGVAPATSTSEALRFNPFSSLRR